MVVCAAVAVLAVTVAAASQGGALRPAPVQAAGLAVRAEPVGRMPTHANPTSPVSAGSTLLLIDQTGYLYRWDGAAAHELLTPATAPAGLKLTGVESLLSVAATDSGNALFIVFTSANAPRGIPQRASNRPGADAWQVFYRYDFNGATLSNPRAITALQVRTDGHTSGGIAALPDESLLFATGDNGDAGEDGRVFPQDPKGHLGKILRINTKDGSVTILGLGVRSVQRLVVAPREGELTLDFVDMGGSVAEEFNSTRVTDLLAAGAPRNFGWGRHADGKAREGAFYIDPNGKAVAPAPPSEPGFIAPLAQFGRPKDGAFGASGSVSSTVSFSRIVALAGDLAEGGLFAITQSRSMVGQPVVAVDVVDADSRPTTLARLAGEARPDPRFFTFPDDAAGVLLEKTGEFFRLTEVVAKDGIAPGAPSANVARDGFFDSAGVRIHFVEQGQGTPVVLMHELDGGIRTWMRAGVFQDLARDHRVIALDCRGHGLSGKPRDVAAYGPEMAMDIVRLLDHLGVARAHIVGYSMGAEIATMLLAAQPDRFITATLIAGAGRFRWLPTDDQHLEEIALEYENIGVSPKLFLERSPDGTPDPTLEELRGLAAESLADPARDVRALAAFSRARRTRLVAPEAVARVRVPTFGIVGSRDPEQGALAALRQLRADVAVTVIDGATHFGPGSVVGRVECIRALRDIVK